MPAKDRTRRRATPRQARARASLEAILQAAELVLRERGFAGATTNRIAARAGVNVALVYRYFAGKEAIVGALIERAAERTYEAVRVALADHAAAPLATAVRAMIEALVDTPGLDPALHRELVEHVDVAAQRPTLAALRARAGARFAEFLAGRDDVLDRARAPAAYFVLQHAIEAAAHAVAFARPRDLPRERAVDALVALVLRELAGTDSVRQPARRVSSPQKETRR